MRRVYCTHSIPAETPQLCLLFEVDASQSYVQFRSDQQQMSNNDFQRIYESSRSLYTHPIIKFYYFSSLIKMVKEGQVNDVQSCNIITNDTCSIARPGRSNCIETNIQCALCLLMDDWWQWNEQCVNILLKGISETSVRNKDDSKLCFQCCYQQIAQRNQRITINGGSTSHCTFSRTERTYLNSSLDSLESKKRNKNKQTNMFLLLCKW